MILPAATALIVVVGAGAFALTVRMQRLAPAAVPAVRAPDPTLRRQPENAVERLVVLLKRKKAARVVLSLVSFSLLCGAAAVVGYPFYTNLYQSRLQGQLDRQIASPEHREVYASRSVGEGDALTVLKIPRLGVETVVVEGTTASALRAGAGHYPSTPLPCEAGNVAIAGHRTTYGRPFHDLDQLETGDRITLTTPIGECTYEVALDPFVVKPTDVEVVGNTPDQARLTLTTCHPKGSARQRLIVTALMVSAKSFDA